MVLGMRIIGICLFVASFPAFFTSGVGTGGYGVDIFATVSLGIPSFIGGAFAFWAAESLETLNAVHWLEREKRFTLKDQLEQTPPS